MRVAPLAICRGILSACMRAFTDDVVWFVRSSDQSLLIYLGRQIALDVHQRVQQLLRLIELRPIPGVLNCHPAYCSVLFTFDAMKLRHEELEETLREYLGHLYEVRLPAPRLVEIPVCYGEEFGPDLDEVAALHQQTPEQVIELHTTTIYLAYFLGFVPGFAYLGELPGALITPRLAIPRRKVPAKSVGIAGNQTGVYPFATPGGWRLLGRTPVSMFGSGPNATSLLRPGDNVRFTSISRAQFADLEHA